MTTSKLFSPILTVAVFLTCLCSSNAAHAQAASNDDDDAAIAVPLTVDRAKMRAYPGGRDEQDLTVQATLPQPTRAIDGQVKVTSEDDDDDQSPAHD